MHTTERHSCRPAPTQTQTYLHVHMQPFMHMYIDHKVVGQSIHITSYVWTHLFLYSSAGASIGRDTGEKLKHWRSGRYRWPWRSFWGQLFQRSLCWDCGTLNLCFLTEWTFWRKLATQHNCVPQANFETLTVFGPKSTVSWCVPDRCGVKLLEQSWICGTFPSECTLGIWFDWTVTICNPCLMFVCTLQALLYVFATVHIEDARLHQWQFGQAPEIYFAGRTHNPNANRIGKDS